MGKISLSKACLNQEINIVILIRDMHYTNHNLTGKKKKGDKAFNLLADNEVKQNLGQ